MPVRRSRYMHGPIIGSRCTCQADLAVDANLQGLQEFERTRRPIIEDYQAAAYESMVWFENARDYMHRSPIELAYSLMKRSGRVDDDELRKRDPEFVREYFAMKSVKM